MSRPRDFGLVAGLFVLLVVLVYSDPLFLRRNFSGRDLPGYNLPIEKAVHDAYARGRLPLWISEISGGRPLLANPNVGALYPLRPVLALLPFPMAMRVFPVLHWTIAGLGVIALLRALALSRSAAWIGAVTYVFSGVCISEVFYASHQTGTALLPVILWAAASRGWPSQRRWLVLGFLFGVDLLSGDVFTAGAAFLAVLLWILLEEEAGRRRRELVSLAASLPLAMVLALPQLVASVLWIPHTVRAISGFRLGEALEVSVSPLRLLELFVPFPFGETWNLGPGGVWGIKALSGRGSGYFATLYAGALAPLALIAAWRLRRRGVRLARALLWTGLALAVPGSLLPSAAKQWRSPLPLRHPEKFVVLVTLALALFAAIGWERLRSADRLPRWIFGAGAVLALVSVLGRVFPLASARVAIAIAGGDTSFLPIARDRLAPAMADGGLLWMTTAVALAIAVRGGRRASLFALILLTVVPIAANRRIAPSFREEEVFAPTAFARRLIREDPAGAYRTLALPSSLTPGANWAGQDIWGIETWRRSWLYFTPALWERGTVFNQDADQGDLSRTESLRRLGTIAAGFTDTTAFFGSLGLRWEIRFRGEPARAGYRRIGGDSVQEWDEHEAPFPDIRVLTRWREEPTAVAALQALPRLRAGEMVLETGLSRSGSGAGGSVRVLERTPERLRLETETSAPTWLFVLRGYFPYRKILVDARPVEASPAQLAFSAIPVPAGRHRIDWTEQIPGGNLSFLGPGVFLAVAALALLRRSSREGS